MGERRALPALTEPEVHAERLARPRDGGEDRVEPVESLLKDPIVFRATTGKRQQQYGNNLPKLRRLSER